MFELKRGDSLKVLRTLPAQSVHCCVTSPPYWGLRDYGVKGQLGLEATPAEYIARLVEIFREVRRVLRDDGTLWLNLGDTYATGGGKVGECPGGGAQGARWKGYRGANGDSAKHPFGSIGPTIQPNRMPIPGLKPKDLVGIPWRVALALQQDGWYLRSDIIWHKPNPMPESVRDRPTKSHEYLFLLTKSERYYYDHVAIMEPTTDPQYQTKGRVRPGVDRLYVQTGDDGSGRYRAGIGNQTEGRLTRNRRTVWTVPTKPFKGAHFAVFPPALIEPCILAGTSKKGCCPTCGAPWKRLTKRRSRKPVDYAGKNLDQNPQHSARRMLANVRAARAARAEGNPHDQPFPAPEMLGWQPSCKCLPLPPEPCVVLDPFTGAGTTGLVSLQHRRRFLGIDLNAKYLKLTHERLTPVVSCQEQATA